LDAGRLEMEASEEHDGYESPAFPVEVSDA
jgi:hypothetical protein